MKPNDALKEIRGLYYNNDYGAAREIMERMSYNELLELHKLSKLAQFNAEFAAGNIEAFLVSQEYA